MKTIAGIVPAAAGRIFLDGQDITHLPIHRRGTVILFQDLRLFPHKTVAENVAFPLKLQGVPRKERLDTARRLLEKEFSMSIILVTHDRAEALSMSHRVALIFDGRIIQTGTPREVYHRPASRRAADYFGGGVYLSGWVTDGVFAAHGVTCPAPATFSWAAAPMNSPWSSCPTGAPTHWLPSVVPVTPCGTSPRAGTAPCSPATGSRQTSGSPTPFCFLNNGQIAVDRTVLNDGHCPQNCRSLHPDPPNFTSPVNKSPIGLFTDQGGFSTPVRYMFIYK